MTSSPARSRTGRPTARSLLGGDVLGSRNRSSYTATRAILLLLLTSALLLTLDLRGTAILDTAREGFQKAMEPFEAAAEVVTNPIRNAWRGITDYEELEQENLALQEELDGQRADQIGGQAAIQAYEELLALNQLPSLSDYADRDRRRRGGEPGNLDQIIEINKGRNDGIDVGMAVVTSAGLVGKVTEPLLPDRAYVMLISDPRYVLTVKVVAPPPPSTSVPADSAPATGTTVAGPDSSVPSSTGGPVNVVDLDLGGDHHDRVHDHDQHDGRPDDRRTAGTGRDDVVDDHDDDPGHDDHQPAAGHGPPVRAGPRQLPADRLHRRTTQASAGRPSATSS